MAEIDGGAIHAAIAEARRAGSESRGRALAAALGKLFSWATQHRKVETNPALGMFRPKPAQSRERVLSDAEVKAVWQTAGEVGFPFGQVVKLLLLTAQRRDEIAAMTWSELSDDSGLEPSPVEHQEQATAHGAFAAAGARDHRVGPQDRGRRFLFSTTGTDADQRLSKFKKQFDARMETEQHWQLHDLRRTAVTGMAELACLPHVVEAVVNHISGHKGDVAGIYNRAVYAPRRRPRWRCGPSMSLPSSAPAMSKLLRRRIQS